MIIVGISARHVHVSEADFKVLFGEDKSLTKLKDLLQPGEYAACEKVDIKVGEKQIKGVRIIGPFRKQSQVEVSKSDLRTLGCDAPIRTSGNLVGSAPIELVGPNGTVALEEGLIIADRHIHMHSTDAEHFGVEHGQKVIVSVDGEKQTYFGDVTIRVSDNYVLEMHIDTDDANAAFLTKPKHYGQIVSLGVSNIN
ncbi:MAG: phosphate propanoyltransferase [Mycoplasmatales bacterium]